MCYTIVIKDYKGEVATYVLIASYPYMYKNLWTLIILALEDFSHSTNKILTTVYKICVATPLYVSITSIDVLPSKNQALCEFCTRVNQLKHC